MPGTRSSLFRFVDEIGNNEKNKTEPFCIIRSSTSAAAMIIIISELIKSACGKRVKRQSSDHIVTKTVPTANH